MSMINKKRLLLAMLSLMLCVSLSAAFAQEDILSSEQMAPEKINYNTRSVTCGSYMKSTTLNASEFYPLTYSVSFDHSSARFIEYTVSRQAEVKAGDVLARFEITASEAELTDMELALENTYQATERGMRQRQAQIADLLEKLETTYGENARQKLLLQLERLVLETERYRFRQQNSIDKQKQALAEAREWRETDVLIAPVDGIVEDIKYKRADEVVYANEVLVQICSRDVMLLYVSDPSGALRYNMEVNVSVGGNNNRTELTGRVVTADNIVSDNDASGYAFIKLDEYDTEEVRLRNIKVSVPTVCVDNVTLVDRQAVVLESGAYYVTKLQDGMVQKRYVIYGAGNAQSAWILNGVTEGETLIID